MALKGHSKFETSKFVSPRDPAGFREVTEDGKTVQKKLSVDEAAANGATVFTVGALDVDTRAMIADRMLVMQQTGDGAANMYVNAGTRNLTAVRYGLRGWSNYRDEKDNDIEFKTVKRIVNGKTYDAVSDETLEHLTPQDLAEIADEILRINNLRDTEAKN